MHLGLPNLYQEINIFSIQVSFHDYLRITKLQGKGKGDITSTPLYLFRSLHRHQALRH